MGRIHHRPAQVVLLVEPLSGGAPSSGRRGQSKLDLRVIILASRSIRSLPGSPARRRGPAPLREDKARRADPV
jgi:hypothetical protein